MRRAIWIACAIMVCFAAAACAHPGGTDAHGGHTDRATGEYHYHHGFAAHQHVGGMCPFDAGYRGGAAAAVAAPRIAEEARAAEEQVEGFAGIEKRGGFGIMASGLMLAVVTIGGFMSTVERRDKRG